MAHLRGNPDPPLTAREIEVVLARVRLGSKRAAETLGLAPSTVAGHCAHAAMRMGARSFSQLVALLYPALGGRYRIPGDD